jgi:hypothetical protein
LGGGRLLAGFPARRTATSVFDQKTPAAGDIAAILIGTLVGVDGWDIALPGLRQLAPLGKEYLGCQALPPISRH